MVAARLRSHCFYGTVLLIVGGVVVNLCNKAGCCWGSVVLFSQLNAWHSKEVRSMIL